MKKSLINFLVTIILAIILSQFLPWWSVMVASFVSALFFSLKKTAVFLIPFLAIFLFWVLYAFWLGYTNNFILSKKIAVLFPLGGSSVLLIIITGIIGGVSGGIAALFGKQCSLLVTKTASD